MKPSLSPAKLAMQGLTCTDIRCVSFFRVREKPKMTLLSIDHNLCRPFAWTLYPRHTLKPTNVVPSEARISAVLSTSGFAQVGAPVVQTVAINVVDKFAVRLSHYRAVHKNTSGALVRPNRTNCVNRALAGHNRPIVTVNKMHIRSVNRGYIPTRQRDVCSVTIHNDRPELAGPAHLSILLYALVRALKDALEDSHAGVCGFGLPDPILDDVATSAIVRPVFGCGPPVAIRQKLISPGEQLGPVMPIPCSDIDKRPVRDRARTAVVWFPFPHQIHSICTRRE